MPDLILRNSCDELVITVDTATLIKIVEHSTSWPPLNELKDILKAGGRDHTITLPADRQFHFCTDGWTEETAPGPPEKTKGKTRIRHIEKDKKCKDL
jgi:hypothetical protein